MFTIYELIEDSILQIKAGINKFNKESESVKAFYPSAITFELYVNNEGKIGGSNKIVVNVPLSYYPYKSDKESK